MDFKKKVVIVTGAAQGLGKATVEKFLGEGAYVAALDINEKELQDVYAGKENVLICKCDVSSEEDWNTVVNKTIAKFGKIDILVNNAARFIFKGLDDLSKNEFESMMQVAMNGAFLGTKAVVAELRKNKGNIVNVNSVASLRSGAIDSGMAGYGAVKGALKCFARYCAAYLAHEEVRVNSVLPGPIDTPALRGYLKENPDGFEAMRAILPPFAAPAEDIANAILFLASDKARCITGAELVVDCGVMTN